MFSSALALLSMLQVGSRVKESFDRLRWQALIIAVAVLFCIAAVAFGLLAAYRLSTVRGCGYHGYCANSARHFGTFAFAAPGPEA
jgi:hypothetical protein